MTWQPRPTETGYYWISDGGIKTVVRFTEGKEGFWLYGFKWPLANFPDARFFGPIEPPPEPEEKQ